MLRNFFQAIFFKLFAILKVAHRSKILEKKKFTTHGNKFDVLMLIKKKDTATILEGGVFFLINFFRGAESATKNQMFFLSLKIIFHIFMSVSI